MFSDNSAIKFSYGFVLFGFILFVLGVFAPIGTEAQANPIFMVSSAYDGSGGSTQSMKIPADGFVVCGNDYNERTLGNGCEVKGKSVLFGEDTPNKVYSYRDFLKKEAGSDKIYLGISIVVISDDRHVYIYYANPSVNK